MKPPSSPRHGVVGGLIRRDGLIAQACEDQQGMLPLSSATRVDRRVVALGNTNTLLATKGIATKSDRTLLEVTFWRRPSKKQKPSRGLHPRPPHQRRFQVAKVISKALLGHEVKELQGILPLTSLPHVCQLNNRSKTRASKKQRKAKNARTREESNLHKMVSSAERQDVSQCLTH